MELKQTKKLLLEVLLVATFFILLVCGVIYIFNKIIESQSVQSSMAFVSQEKILIEENIKNKKLWVEDFSKETENYWNNLATWLHIKLSPTENNENIDSALTETTMPSNASLPEPEPETSTAINQKPIDAATISVPDLSSPEKIKEFQQSQGIPPTGVIGDLTRNALKRLKENENNTANTYHAPDLSSPEKIKEFQQSQGIPPTGVIGDLTRNALKRLQDNAINLNALPASESMKPIKN